VHCNYVIIVTVCCDNTEDQNATAVLGDTRGEQQHYTVLTFWDSRVAVVGIGLCTGVIVASLSFVFYQRLTLRRLRAKQDTQTPAYRALVAGKHKNVDAAPGLQDSNESKTGQLQPRSPHITTTRLTSSQTPLNGHRTAAVKLSSTSPVRQREVTPSSAHKRRDARLATSSSPLTSSRAAATELTVFQARPTTCKDPAPLRAGRSRSKSPREVLECVCLVADSGVVDQDAVMLETRPPVEGRDSLSVEQVLDEHQSEPSTNSAAAAALKTASYVPPTQCSIAVLRCLERVGQPTQVTRGTSPMSASDLDALPDISGLLTSGTETDDVDDVMTMTGAPSSSSLSDLVAGCDVEFDSDDCIPPRANATAQRRLYKAAWVKKARWTARKHQRDAMLEPDVYYC